MYRAFGEGGRGYRVISRQYSTLISDISFASDVSILILAALEPTTTSKYDTVSSQPADMAVVELNQSPCRLSGLPCC